jgi:hypothetical protein
MAIALLGVGGCADGSKTSGPSPSSGGSSNAKAPSGQGLRLHVEGMV